MSLIGITAFLSLWGQPFVKLSRMLSNKNLMRIISISSALVAGVFILSACAPSVSYRPAYISQQVAPSAPAMLRLAESVEVEFDTGYRRVVSAGTHWLIAGDIPEGRVLRPYNSVFTVEGDQNHEAWLVVKDEVLQGFYLPAERAFTPLRKKINMQFSTTLRKENS